MPARRKEEGWRARPAVQELVAAPCMCTTTGVCTGQVQCQANFKGLRIQTCRLQLRGRSAKTCSVSSVSTPRAFRHSEVFKQFQARTNPDLEGTSLHPGAHPQQSLHRRRSGLLAPPPRCVRGPTPREHHCGTQQLCHLTMANTEDNTTALSLDIGRQWLPKATSKDTALRHVTVPAASYLVPAPVGCQTFVKAAHMLCVEASNPWPV